MFQRYKSFEIIYNLYSKGKKHVFDMFFEEGTSQWTKYPSKK